MKTNAVNTSEKIKYNVFGPCRLKNAGRKGKPSNECDVITVVGRPRRTLNDSFNNNYYCRRLYTMTNLI